MYSPANPSSPHATPAPDPENANHLASPTAVETPPVTFPSTWRAKATRVTLTVSVLIGSLAGCSKHSELTLYVSGEVTQGEVERVTASVATPVDAVEAHDGNWRIRFRDVIAKEDRIFLDELLDQAVRVSGFPPPKLALQITEQDAEIQRIANVTPDAEPQQFELEVDDGKRALFAVETLLGTQRVCTWSVPARGLPQLGYDTRLAGNTTGEEARRTFKQAFGSVQTFAGRVAHQFTFVPPESTKAAAEVHIEPPRSVVFTFERAAHSGVRNTAFGTVAGAGEFASCMQTVVANSDDGFFGTFLFPQLSDKLTRYELENGWF